MNEKTDNVNERYWVSIGDWEYLEDPRDEEVIRLHWTLLKERPSSRQPVSQGFMSFFLNCST